MLFDAAWQSKRRVSSCDPFEALRPSSVVVLQRSVMEAKMDVTPALSAESAVSKGNSHP